MNIPLNHLYNHLGSLIGPDTLIYRFFPHGGKNLIDLGYNSTHLSWHRDVGKVPISLIMHDQEPLNFDFYNYDYMRENITAWFDKHNPTIGEYLKSPELFDFWCHQNLNFLTHSNQAWTLYDKNILVHSEKNSPEIKKYQDIGLVTSYWWSHAIIARDWYRYAEHDPALKNLPVSYQKTFNIYNRAWGGTREYRLKLADYLLDAGIINHCNIKFNPVDNNVHYSQHQFKNQNFKPINQLDRLLQTNNAPPSASAEYSSVDYSNCWFDVVLETLYDDSRLHLTEKTLRPIACGKPFILVGTPGSLEYLRSYGFKTFDGIIDERYDLIQDPILRLKAITDTMKSISKLHPDQAREVQLQLKSITEYNQRRFFSKEFVDQILDEFVCNVAQAKAVCEQNRFGKNIINFRKLASQDTVLKKKLLQHQKDHAIKLLLEIRKLNE